VVRRPVDDLHAQQHIDAISQWLQRESQ
jgi:hypothetical protein